jgi:hypothetical protein
MTLLDDFVSDARTVMLDDVFAIVGGVRRRANRAGEEVGPCPCCADGKDRFSINFVKQVWSCRHYDRRGGDALELMAHKEGLDLKRRSEFLLACSLVQGGRPIPEGGERETEDERAAREKRNAERRAEAEADRQRSETDANAYREKAITRGRGIYFNAGDGPGSVAEAYLKRRTGSMTIPVPLWENIRFQPAQSYWHGKDVRGHDVELHCGPALIAPLVDLTGRITGCHQTWIDLDHGPKFRPVLRDDKGEPLPTKKMQGAKKGSIVPVLGDLDATRWVCGEGIETVLAIASAEAAGDLGTWCGPAEAGSSFNHPTLKKADAKGRMKPVRIPGPVPKPASGDDAFQLPDHVTACVLLCDGDSEPVFTFAAMARAEARLMRDNLAIETWWPAKGGDFADMAVRAAATMNAA